MADVPELAHDKNLILSSFINAVDSEIFASSLVRKFFIFIFAN